jgi:mevalonate kinase
LRTATHQITASARAPGKIILAGEQFVVLGAPAIAMAINFYSKAKVQQNKTNSIGISLDVPLKFIAGSSSRPAALDSEEFLRPLRIAAEATLARIGRIRGGIDVSVDCDIPVGAGLGSSASTTVAIISAVAKSQRVELGRKDIFKLAFIPERFLHGKPSGVDQATCIYGGTIQFTRPSIIKPVQIKTEPILLLCDTKIHHETKTLVGSVVKKSQREKDKFRAYLNQVKEISRGVLNALKAGDPDDLGVLMSQNHELLQRIGVSHPKLDRLINVARRSGALGAKLTGAGGGGCLIAVCSSHRSRDRISKVLRREGGTPYRILTNVHGVETIPN